MTNGLLPKDVDIPSIIVCIESKEKDGITELRISNPKLCTRVTPSTRPKPNDPPIQPTEITRKDGKKRTLIKKTELYDVYLEYELKREKTIEGYNNDYY